MKRIGIIVAILLVVPLLCMGQGKFYTKKARLRGYENKITKVVLSGNVVFDKALQRSMPVLWQINTYEFCTAAEYEKIKTNPGYFFIRPVTMLDSGSNDSGLVCLHLSKGGGKNRESMDAATDYASLPVSSDFQMLSDIEIACIPAYLSILQQFIVDAAGSERVANLGLSAYTWYSKTPKGISICFDDGKSAKMMEESYPEGAVGVVIGPSDGNRKSQYYHMVIGTDNYRLYYFVKMKGNASFSKAEREQIIKKFDGNAA